MKKIISTYLISGRGYFYIEGPFVYILPDKFIVCVYDDKEISIIPMYYVRSTIRFGGMTDIRDCLDNNGQYFKRIKYELLMNEINSNGFIDINGRKCNISKATKMFETHGVHIQ